MILSCIEIRTSDTFNVKTLKSQMAQNIKIATEQAQFVKDYLSKNKAQRKLMLNK